MDLRNFIVLPEKDPERWKVPGATFDEERADFMVELIQEFGSTEGLSKWERKLIRGLFGWRRIDEPSSNSGEEKRAGSTESLETGNAGMVPTDRG